MGKAKWIPFPEDMPDAARNWPVSVGYNHRALLTLRGNDGRLHVDFYPDFGRCMAYMEISPSTEDPDGWKHEHHGEDPPRKGWYLVTVEVRSGGKYGSGQVRYKLEKSLWDEDKYRWCRERGRPEVVAWREIPKPYGRRK